ncbi:MAG TPA: right-handed parallel beta-helix repeat-containing protein [Spirochaetota bacterium]|nr:right-handed parallel beta-helix repeat-containing protein [Spirochaetota bacterium]
MESRSFAFYRFMVMSVIVSTCCIAAAGCGNLYNDILNRNKILIPFFDRIIRNNAVGATTSTTLRSLDFTPSDSNAVFVAKNGSDITGSGTMGNPFISINRAIAACDATHQSVVILDSGTYEEKGFEFIGNFRGLFAAIGSKPVVNVIQNNNYFYMSGLKAETTFTTNNMNYLSSTTMKDGNILIVYQDNTDSHKANYKVFNNESWTVEHQGTLPIADILCITVKSLPNGNLFFAYNGWNAPRNGRFMVINPMDWNVVKEDTSFNTCTTGPLSTLVLPNGNILIAFDDYDVSQEKFIVMNPEDWTIVKSETVINNTEAWFISAELLHNGNIIFFYGGHAPCTGRIKIINPDDWSIELPETAIIAENTIGVSVSILANGNILLVYSNLNQGKYCIIDRDDYSTITLNTFHTSAMFEVASTVMQNGDIVISYDDTADAQQGKYIVLSPKLNQHILISTDAELNGITLIPDVAISADSLIHSPISNIKARWCDFRDNIGSITGNNGAALTLNGEIDIRNCIIYNNGSGVVATTDKAIISDSQLYKNTNGYALHINGAAVSPGDITIDHCDFFGNQGGLRLEGNSGNEVVKNSIFHDNAGTGISADTPVTLAHSIITDSVDNVIPGESLVGDDPLYVNEGDPAPEDIDLNLRSIFGGFPANSPALFLGDDGRNAGAFDVEYRQ